MGTLAIDIETASPFQEPGSGEDGTEYYEWVAVAVGYRPDDESNPETDVFFRRGDWKDEHTAKFFDQLLEWCNSRDIDRTLTYNGAGFDFKHICNWAEQIDSKGIRTDTYPTIQRTFPTHIDLAPAVTDQHKSELLDKQPCLPLWKACQLEEVNEERVWYEDYNLDEDYISSLGISDRFVKAQHVGQAIGERFIKGIDLGMEETLTHQRLQQLLYDYAVGDVDVLFGLYDALGGANLERDYEYPLDEIDR